MSAIHGEKIRLERSVPDEESVNYETYEYESLYTKRRKVCGIFAVRRNRSFVAAGVKTRNVQIFAKSARRVLGSESRDRNEQDKKLKCAQLIQATIR